MDKAEPEKHPLDLSIVRNLNLNQNGFEACALSEALATGYRNAAHAMLWAPADVLVMQRYQQKATILVRLTLFTWLILESLSPSCPSAQMLPPPLPDCGPFNKSFIPAHPMESLAFGGLTPSTTASSPARNLSCGDSVLEFSGHGNIARSMAPDFRFAPMQLCTFSLYAKKSDDICLLLFPCPVVLCETVHDCFSVAFLLLCSGDIETNPGPTTRSESLSEIDSLPAQRCSLPLITKFEGTT
ncbi:uncharacterized protein LOC142584669 isoform X1 [Dermacentor variabilis]|uniref:uncharacterized protein LOC142584669 isoform X1 n=1 Tax=Dermacentor variabilis TaxID=34621 RepID=UPI003F5CBB4D